MPKKARNNRVITILREQFPGKWHYDQSKVEWVRADGMRVFCRVGLAYGEDEDGRADSLWYYQIDDKIVPLYWLIPPTDRIWIKLNAN